MEERLQALEAQNKELQAQMTLLQIEIVKISARQEALMEKVDKYSSGINRALWILGGGFMAAIVTWITGGGLER